LQQLQSTAGRITNVKRWSVLEQSGCRTADMVCRHNYCWKFVGSVLLPNTMLTCVPVPCATVQHPHEAFGMVFNFDGVVVSSGMQARRGSPPCCG
jgi:hypothetical protein